MSEHGAERTTVLLVDDGEDLVEYTGRRLAARGLEVSVAHDGATALERYRSRPVDVVVLDVLMPGIDGLETLRRLRRLDPDVQVVLLTGHGAEETAAAGRELGAEDFLLKPVALGSLIGAIERAAKRRAGRRGPQK